jgi:hypothetical protein
MPDLTNADVRTDATLRGHRSRSEIRRGTRS